LLTACRSEIDGAAVDFPVAEAGGIGAAAAAEFFWSVRLCCCLPALLGFLQSALGSRRERFARGCGLDLRFAVVVVGRLHFIHRMVY